MRNNSGSDDKQGNHPEYGTIRNHRISLE